MTREAMTIEKCPACGQRLKPKRERKPPRPRYLSAFADKIRQLYLEGRSITAIAETLYADGVRPPVSDHYGRPVYVLSQSVWRN